MSTSDYFKKFMDSFEKKDVEKKDKQKEYAKQYDDNPYRKYNEVYQERWQNRIRYGWRDHGKK